MKGDEGEMETHTVTRRDFLKTAACAVAAGAAVSSSDLFSRINPIKARANLEGQNKIIRSSCMRCQEVTSCGIQATVENGRIIRLEGNPYCPLNNDYASAGDIVVESDIPPGSAGRICAKGRSGALEPFDPFRIKHPLKRTGPRGAGQWKAISWDEAYKEIIEGGMLPGGREGEPEYRFEGLKSIRNFEEIGPEESDYLDEAPPGGYGPKANQLGVYTCLTAEPDIQGDFFRSSFGTINDMFCCGNLCDENIGQAMYFTFPTPELPLPQPFGMKPDIEDATYMILSCNPISSGDPMVSWSNQTLRFLENGGKLVILDPRFSPSAAKAHRWVPIKPATDAAFYLGLMRWIIENNKHAADYLSRPNKDAATKGGYINWTNATYLVRLDNGAFLRAKDAGIGDDEYVVSVAGVPKKHDEVVETADLDVTITVNGVPCKSSFSLLRERVQEKTIAEYESICDIPAGTISTIASELTSALRPVVFGYRGVNALSNGFYTSRAMYMLDVLLDRIDRRGGIGGYGVLEGSANYFFPGFLRERKYQEKLQPSGVPHGRTGVTYQGKKEFPTRPWFPLAPYLSHMADVMPSIAIGYPYKMKALFNIWSNPAYSTPNVDAQVKVMQNTKAIPLLISIDPFMSETTSYCDYVLADVTYLERWGTSAAWAPIEKTPFVGIRQPVIGTVDPVTHEYKSVCPDAKGIDQILIDIAVKLGLPNFGKDSLGPGKDLYTAWDYWNTYFTNGIDPNTTHMKMGGIFMNPAVKFDETGETLKWAYGGCIHIYSEALATTKNSMTGKYFDGLAKYLVCTDIKDNPIEDKGYDFVGVNYKLPQGAQSVMMHNTWLRETVRENYFEMNASDAARLGIKTEDKVRVSSPSNPEGIIGKAKVSEGVRPGVIAVSHHFGKWARGSQPFYIDGVSSGSCPEMGYGVTLNRLGRLDPVLGDTPLMNSQVGGVSYNEVPLKVEKA